MFGTSSQAGGMIQPMVDYSDGMVYADDDGFHKGSVVQEIEGDEFEDEFADDDEPRFDPLSGYNRLMTNVNDRFYTYLLMPVAKGYRNVMPKPIRLGVKNFFTNIWFPVRFVNNALQMKFTNAKDEILRFGINSTVGVLGLFDPATHTFHIKAHEEDFRQTLGHYGVGRGIPIVLPLFGPSNARAFLGNIADGFVNPVYNVNRVYYNDQLNSGEAILVRGVEVGNRASFKVGEYEKIKEDAVDLYPFFQGIYEQHEDKLIEE